MTELEQVMVELTQVKAERDQANARATMLYEALEGVKLSEAGSTKHGVGVSAESMRHARAALKATGADVHAFLTGVRDSIETHLVVREMSAVAFVSRDLVERAFEVLVSGPSTGPELAQAAVLLKEALGK